MIDSNYLIINRKPRRFSEMRLAGSTAVFIGEDGKVIDYGVLAMDSSVYAALYCDEVRNITFVTDRGGARTVTTVLWVTEDDYRAAREALGRVCSVRFSVQNLRLNRYAEAIAEKLDNGVRLRVTDAVDESEMAVCPECGMHNPPGSNYCLECGADL